MSTLNFTIDPGFLTRQVRAFAYEGSYKRVVDILVDAGIEDKVLIRAALQGRLLFLPIEGEQDLFDMEIHEKPMEAEFLVTGLRTLRSSLQSQVQRQAYESYPFDPDEDDDSRFNQLIWEKRWKYINERAPEIDLYHFIRSKLYTRQSGDLEALLKYFLAEELNEWISPEFVLKTERGYNVFTLDEYLSARNKGERLFEYPEPSGVILESGTIVECHPQQHNLLFPVLKGFGLTDSNGHMTGVNGSPEEMRVIPLTGGHLGFGTANALRDLDHTGKGNRHMITDGQLITLFHLRDEIDGFTGSFRTGEEQYMIQILAHYLNYTQRCGAKYAYLELVEMGGFNTPVRSLDWFPDADCIRSSPSHSMPGVLNSYFGLSSSDDFLHAQQDMQMTWESTEDSTKKWKFLSYFYQKSVPGVLTGVGHWYGEGNLTYAVSPHHDALTSGKAETVNPTQAQDEAIFVVLEQLGDMCKFPIQVEFTIDENHLVTILQLKPLKNTVDQRETEIPEGAIPAVGFSKGHVYEAYIGDVLVVDEDIDPGTSLDGIKAVIVRHDTIFSHVLAMAQNKRIPAVYGVGDIDLPEVMDIMVESTSAYIVGKK